MLVLGVITVGVKIGIMVLGIGLSILAGKLLADKARKAIISDDKPTTLSQRGSYVPLLNGRRRVGAIFAWAGDRFSKKEKIAGSKGGKGGSSNPVSGKQEQTIWFENGWHVICIGPANKLWRIWQHGDILFGKDFQEPLTPATHPSGTTVSFGNEGQMTIFWGEKLQPINTDLGVSNRVGISSRWPFMCYVYWEAKRLSTSPIWPLLEYEIEVRPNNDNISVSDSWIEPDRGTLWSGVITDKIYKQKGFTSTQVASFSSPSGDPRGVATLDTGVDNVLVLDTGTDSITRHDGFSSTILSTIAITTIDNAPEDVSSGFPATGTRLFEASHNTYFCGRQNDKLYELAGFSTSVNSSLDISTIAVDPQAMTMWSDQNLITTDSTNLVQRIITDLIGKPSDACYMDGNNIDVFRLTGFTTTVKTTINLSGVIPFGAGMSADGPADHILFTTGIGTDRLLQFASFTTTINASVDVTAVDNAPTGIEHELTSERLGVGKRSDLIQGANAAHVFDQLLFKKYPHGIGVKVADFDLPSLETIGTTLDFPAEFLPTNLIFLEGEKFQSGMAALMQDIGMFISWNVEAEKYVFSLIRKPTGLLPAVTLDLQVDALPERTVIHDDLAADRIVFAFPDRERNYRDTTLTLNDDGQAELVGVTKSRTSRLITITDFETAQKVTERRAQEEMVAPTRFKIKSARGFRKLVPGDPFTLDGVAQVLRLVGIGLDTESDEVVLESIVDSYGLAVSTVIQNPGMGQQVLPDPDFKDKTFTFYEMNKYLAEGKVSIFVPRLRANLNVSRSFINISRLGLTFRSASAQNSVYSGGTLKDPIAIDDPSIIVTGPEIDVLGPDIGDVQDLTGDDFSWKAGRQICLINDELFFIQKITFITPTVVRLDNLVRARLATARAAHPIGSDVYIIDDDEVQTIEDKYFVPGQNAFVKSLPQELSEFTDLSSVLPVIKLLKGDALRGLPVENINSDIGDRTWAAGTDLDIEWSYRSTIEPRTGAGQQAAGEATTKGTIQGTFTVRIRDIADVLKNTFAGLTTNAFTYTNAQMVTDFAGEPASLKVEVVNVDNGLESDVRIVTMEQN